MPARRIFNANGQPFKWGAGQEAAPTVSGEGFYIYDLISDVEYRINVVGLVVQQTIDAEWNEAYTFGKMDPISTYKGTKRSFQIGFVIATNAYNNLNILNQLMYPSFIKTKQSSTGGGISAETARQRFGLVFNVPVLKIFHNTFLYDFTKGEPGETSEGVAKDNGLLGYIKDLKIESLKGGFRQPGVEYFSVDGVSGVSSVQNDSKSYKVSFVFTPLHQNLLDRQDENFRKNFPYRGSFDTDSRVSDNAAQVRLKNAKLDEFFTFSNATITSTPAPAATAAAAPVPATPAATAAGTAAGTPAPAAGTPSVDKPPAPAPPDGVTP
jgi:hypothetical protein